MKAMATLASKGINIGDIVQYQDKGYYRVEGVDADNSHVVLRGVLAKNLTKTPNSKKKLYACWCKLVTKHDLLLQLHESIKLVEEVFDGT